MQLLVDLCIGLSKNRAALTVPQYHITTTDILEHPTTQFTRKSPIWLAVDILST